MSDRHSSVQPLGQRGRLIKSARRWGRIALIAAVALGSWQFYGGWRKQHLAKQAEQFVARGEYQSAVLVVRRLLELDSNNVAAARAMAEIAEKAGRPEAIEWRRKIASLEPNVAANQMALARTALHFGQSEIAERVLKSLPQPAQSGLDYHQLAGATALARKQTSESEMHFAAAVQTAPTDPNLALHLALVRLASASDPKLIEQARLSLMGLTETASVRLESLRALTAEALARQDRTVAQKWATQLAAETNATFSDALLCLQAVEGTDAAAAALARLQAKAAASSETAAGLITWLNRHGMAQAAITWKSSLPASIIEMQPVPLALAESYSFLQDWEGLHRFVEGRNWGAFESLRLAVESHALRRLNSPERPSLETETLWRAALKEAQTHPGQLFAIAELAKGWGYQAEAEEAWWTIANGRNDAKAGLSALQRFYKQKQDTRGLLRVAKRAVELNPADLIAVNNCASLGLLVSGDSTSRRLAARLHEEHPSNRAFAATCAYALHTEGKLTEGLTMIETLKEEELRDPGIAAYYVVMLVDNGKFDRARSFLVDAKRAVLLPEEQQLLTAATRKLLANETDAAANVGAALAPRLATSFVTENAGQ